MFPSPFSTSASFPLHLCICFPTNGTGTYAGMWGRLPKMDGYLVVAMTSPARSNTDRVLRVVEKCPLNELGAVCGCPMLRRCLGRLSVCPRSSGLSRALTATRQRQPDRQPGKVVATCA